jgi:PAS domain-containing protein
MSHDHSALAQVLLKCSQLAARAGSDAEALETVCQRLVGSGLFHGASIGFHQTGQHKDTTSNQCFLLKVDGQLLGALVLSSEEPDTFDPQLVEMVGDWCETFAHLLATARRRALHGRANAWQPAESDLEELRRTEAALRRSEAFLGKAQRLSQTGSFSWTTSTGVVVWSDETFRIFGYPPAQTPSLALILERVHPDERAATEALLAQAQENGVDLGSELRLLMPDQAHPDRGPGHRLPQDR